MIKDYLKSFRLRTLPLSVSGIILGTFLYEGPISWIVFVLAMLTTLSLQILTNLANELGDALKGTDGEQSMRDAYGLQSGKITVKQIKRCISIFILLSIVFGSMLIYTAFETLFSMEVIAFFALGALSIIAAIKYTIGKRPYGYYAMGDVAVFLFFGLLSCMGGYYLQAQEVTMKIFLAATAIGLPIVAVLNLNNMRDMVNDIIYHKRTVASVLGLRNAKIYHSALIIFMFLIFVLIKCYVALVFVPIFFFHLYKVWTCKQGEFDKQMPILSLSTLATALTVGIVC